MKSWLKTASKIPTINRNIFVVKSKKPLSKILLVKKICKICSNEIRWVVSGKYEGYCWDCFKKSIEPEPVKEENPKCDLPSKLSAFIIEKQKKIKPKKDAASIKPQKVSFGLEHSRFKGYFCRILNESLIKYEDIENGLGNKKYGFIKLTTIIRNI